MSADGIEERRVAAEQQGYRFAAREQSEADLSGTDCIVVVTTPDGRTLFPPAIDDDEPAALRRAVERAEHDVASRLDPEPDPWVSRAQSQSQSHG